MNNKAIGIFDSGVGGLTVLTEIEKIMPNEDIIYIGDTKRFPYGNKTKESIIEISKQITKYLILNNVKLIVIACGTATSQALEELKSIYNIPIIGIITPTIENKITNSVKKVGVIATRGTIRSGQWENQIHEKNVSTKVISVEAPLLAPMAEEGWIDNEIARLTIMEYSKSFKNENINQLILGCTHYPLFKKIFRQELGENVELINTGEEIAKYLKKYLTENKLENTENKNRKVEISLTDTECNFLNVAKILLGKEVEISIAKLDK